MTSYDPVLAEEVAWLRGFGWDPARIARRLNCETETVQHYIRRYLSTLSTESTGTSTRSNSGMVDPVRDAFDTARGFAEERRVVQNNTRAATVEQRRIYRRVS